VNFEDRYLVVADAFTERVHGVTAWGAPTPCDGWVASDVVRHLVEWVPGFVAAFAGLDSSPVRSVDDDPAGAWSDLDAQLRGWLADPTVADSVVEGPMGAMPVADLIDRFVTTDVWIHTWDLARSAGLDDLLVEQESMEAVLAGMEPMDAALRSSGHYGPRVAVAPDASVQDRLLAFMGRDPNWSPPT
jgi:uncharacterized protein (TIGR03086 family)